ncbi:MAG: hypothetical protein OXE93_05230 [bacterium]|nr:hypothetical protein [bacterium]
MGGHRADLEENRAAPNLLHNLAMAYFAFIVEVDQRASPQERISQFLGDDVELTGVVLTALREAAFRDDLPEVDSTISHRAGLRDFIGTHNERSRHLAEMLRGCAYNQSWGPSIMGQCSDAALLCDVIQMLGSLYGPLFPAGRVTLEVDASDRIASMISLLAAMPSEAAQESLTDLSSDPQLTSWHKHIQHASESQRVLLGDASYITLSTEQVQNTLSNQNPANVCAVFTGY